MAKLNSILETIGQTPVIRLNRLAPEGVHLYVKVEAFNPMGSVKDRLALGIIQDAEKRGTLTPGQTVIEATSGNTGIGLAMVCAERGYPLVVTMAENFSVERRKILRFLGARIVLTPGSHRGTGMLAKAEELAAEHGWFLCRQFDNEANADIHSRTTAREILDDFEDPHLDYWVTGFGTGGTLRGVSRVLKKESPGTRIVVCEPDNAPLLGSGIPQPLNAQGELDGGHPSFRPHLMQGWSPDFIPGLTRDAVAENMIDHTVPVDGMEALRLSRELARQEGIFTGISGGATLAGALQIARQAAPGATILCMLPDTGERYLTTPLFAEIAVDMTPDEMEISQSTAGYRFDGPSSAAAAPATEEEVLKEAVTFIDQATGNRDEPVVMFALTWCEFCWSVRRFFDHMGIPYRAVNLDAVEYQEDDFGGRIRTALTARTTITTIPQIFISGQFLGGCTEVFDAFKSGDLQEHLDDAAVSFRRDVSVDPYSFLPAWLHPR